MSTWFPHAIKDLVEALTAFPDVGPKTAAKYLFFLKHRPQAELDSLANLIKTLRDSTSMCPRCFRTVDKLKHGEMCNICADPKRDQQTIVLVERELDAEPLDRAGYTGVYFITGSLLYAQKGLQKASIASSKHSIPFQRLTALGKRLRTEPVRELIIAFNPTPQGDASAAYLAAALARTGIKITRLGRGLPTGADLRYADTETLQGAFRGRTKL